MSNERSARDEWKFEPLTDEQVDFLLLGTDEVVHEMSRSTMVNALVLLAREVKRWRSQTPTEETP